MEAAGQDVGQEPADKLVGGERHNALAFGSITAVMPAVLTGFNVTSERSGAAVLNRRHHLELGKAQVPGVGNPVRRSSSAEDVCHLE